MKRVLSLLLAVSLSLSGVPSTVWAEESAEDVTDSNYRIVDSGYIEETQPEEDADPDEEIPSEEVPLEDTADPAVAEVQAMIDALPTVEELAAMDLDGQRAAYGQTQTAYDAYMALSDEQRGLITGAGVFDELFDFFNGQTMPLEDSAFGGGDGTFGTPYQISTRAHLEQLATDVNNGNSYSGKYFKLINDINLGGSSSPWTPIGSNNSTGFDGTFDGGNQTVSGLYINSTSDFQGLFGRITSNGAIQYLSVDGFVTGGKTVGGIVGYNYGTITNCSNSSSITGSNGYVGGIVGYNANTGTITDCSNSGLITGSTGSADYVGGVVGCNYSGGKVERCNNSGDVSGSLDVGGVVGYNGGTVEGCNNNNNTVTGTGNYVGGVVGYNGGTVEGCNNNNNTVTGTGNYVGGVVGCNFSGGKVEKCHNTGNVQSNSDRVGGIAGYNYNGSTITNCSNSGSITGSQNIGGIAGYNNSGTITSCRNSGSITGSATYVGGVVGYNTSTVEGCSNNNNTVTGTDNYVGGIAGYNTSTGTITDCSNSGSITSNGRNVGGIAGCNSNRITSCSNSGSITSRDSEYGYVGGVVGGNYNSGIVEKCYNTGSVLSGSTYAGGVVGYNYGTSIINCYNTGKVSVTRMVGGVTGNAANNAVVRYCYNIGTVEATTIGVDGYVHRGGVAGYNSESTIEYCYYLEGCGASSGVGYFTNGTSIVWNKTTEDFKSLASTLNSNGNSNVWTDSPTLGHPVLIDNREDRIPFGGEIPEESATIEATYGQTKTQTFNLDNYIQYKDNSHASGNFTYTVSTLPSGITAQVNGSQLTVTLSNTVNVGTYTLTIIAHEDNPKIATVAITDFDKIDVVLTVKVRINKAPATATVTGQTLTYNGSAQNLVTGSTSDGTLSYSLEQNGTFGSTPTATNAGSYTVYYRVVGDSNHTDISGNVTATINPKSVTPTITVSPSNFTYDGTAKTPSSVTVMDGTTTIPANEYSVSYSNNTNAGNATVTITDNSGGNYTVSGSTTYSITKATPTASMFTYTAPTNLNYDGNAKTAAVTLKSPYTNAGTITVKYNGSDTPPKDAGTYTVTIDVAGGNNFNSASGIQMGSFTIQPKNISGATITLAQDTFTYNGNQQTVSITSVKVDNLTLAASDYDISNGNSGTNANSYTLNITGTGNFTGIATTTWKINKVALFPSVTEGSVPDKTYNGNTNTAGEITLTGAVNSEQPRATGTFNFVDKTAGENKAVKVTDITLTGSWGDNYELSTNALNNQSTTAKISPLIAVLEWDGVNTFVYNGNSHSVTAELTNKVEGDTVTLRYEGNVETDQGEYIAKVIGFDGTDGGNYTLDGVENTTLEWSIGGRSIEGAVVTVTSEHIYNGKPQNPTVNVTVNGVLLTQKIDYILTYDGGIINPGEYTVTVTGINNYSGTKTGSFTVKKAKLIPEVSAENKTYNGNTDATGTITLTGAAQGENPTGAGIFAFADKNAGDGKTVNVTNITLDEEWTTNYELSTDNLTTTANIRKLAVTLTWDYAEPFIFEEGKTYTVTAQLIGKLGNDDVTLSYEENTGSDAKEYTAKVTLTGDDSGNYTLEKDTLTWIINVASQPTPSAKIDYLAEKLTGIDTAMQYHTGNNNWQSCSEDMTLKSIGWNGAAMTVYFRYPAKPNYAESGTQTLVVPARPKAPEITLKLTKTDTSITITGTSGTGKYEFSRDGESWNSSSFTGLNAGETYTILARASASESAFVSYVMEQSVTTVDADGSTTLRPGETVRTGSGSITNNGDDAILDDGTGTTTVTPPKGEDFHDGIEADGDGNVTVPNGSTVTPPGGPDITVNDDVIVDEGGNVTFPDGGSAQVGDAAVTVPEGGTLKPDGKGSVDVPGGSTVHPGNNGPNITVNDDTIVDGDDNVTFPDGGSAQVGDTTVTVPKGGTITPNEDGTVTVPNGSTIIPPGGPDITVNDDAIVDGDGNVTFPDGGSAQVGDTTVTVPKGGTITPHEDGTVTVPDGSTVIPPGGPDITVNDDAIVDGDGNVTFPDGGSAQVGDTTVTVPKGGTISPNEDGSITVPDGSTVTPPGGPDITMKDDAIVDEGGNVTLPEGGSAQVGDATVTLPEGGGTLKPNGKGGVELPGGTIVEVPGAGSVTIPPEGGVYYPETGDVETKGTKGKVTVGTRIGEGAPAVTFEMDESAELTVYEKLLVGIGSDISFVLSVENITDTVSAPNQQLTEAQTKDRGYEIGRYLDMALFKVIDGEENALTTTNKEVRIKITIPEDLRGGTNRSFAVIRVHGGAAAWLDDLDSDAATITILTDRFSPYAIVYQDLKQSGNSGGSSGSDDRDRSSGSSSSSAASSVPEIPAPVVPAAPNTAATPTEPAAPTASSTPSTPDDTTQPPADPAPTQEEDIITSSEDTSPTEESSQPSGGNNLIPWIVLMCVSGLVVLAVLFKIRRDKSTQER